jgi:hypothetical protein
MNIKNKIKDLETIREVFDKFGVRLIVGYGALLGMYRDGKLIEYDDDMDLIVIDKIDLKTRKDIGWTLHSLGFNRQHIGFNVFGRMEDDTEGYNGTEETGILVIQRNFNFTIFFFYEEDCEKHGREYVCIPKLGALKLISTPKKFYEKLGEIKINKKKYLTPYPIEKYLEYCYENWKDKNGTDHSPSYPKLHQ